MLYDILQWYEYSYKRMTIPTRNNDFRRDLRQLTRCKSVIMEKGWERSFEARKLHELALCLNLTIRYE